MLGRRAAYSILSGDARVSFRYELVNITNQKFNLTFTPQLVFGGCRKFTHDEFGNLTLSQCEEKWEEWELENYKAYQKLYLERLERMRNSEGSDGE